MNKTENSCFLKKISKKFEQALPNREYSSTQ